MVKMLGAIDLIAAAILVSTALGVEVPIEALIVIPVCLFFKAFIAIYDIGGITDAAVAILIVLGIFIHLPSFVLLAPAVVIGFKGIMSLFAS